MKKILESFFPLLWMLFSLYLFLASPSELGTPLFDFPHKDKIAHLVIFGALAFLWLRFFNRTNPKKGINSSVLIKVGSIVLSWAILTESMQGLLTMTRSADILDVCADVIGGILGLMAYSILNKSIFKIFC